MLEKNSAIWRYVASGRATGGNGGTSPPPHFSRKFVLVILANPDEKTSGRGYVRYIDGHI